MAASAIIVSSDSSDESVGSPPSRVILFGDISTVIPSTYVIALETSASAHVISTATPVVETTLVASPTGLCGLVPYSDSDSDSPDEIDSIEYITALPATSPFLYTDSSEASDSSDGPPSQDPYAITVARWRSRVTARSSSPSDFPIAPVTASPRIRRRAAILIRPGEAIPLGRPYRTHPNGPQRVMTTRKRVGPLPARRLAWRRRLLLLLLLFHLPLPVVKTTLVASPNGLCGLVPYSDSDSDSPMRWILQSTLPHYQLLHHSYTPILLRLLILSMDHHRMTLMLLTLLVGGAGVMTMRKRVGPLPAHRLAWRRVSPRSLDHCPSSSSSPMDSSPVHSSGLDAPDQAHSGSSTRVVSPRLGYLSVRSPRHSEAFRRWCAALLSTFYPPTTSKSSSGDSSERPLHSSSHSAGPSRKRCRSLVDFVPSSTPVTGSLDPTRADLLPPRKRYRDSYSSETSMEEDTEIDTTYTEDGIELDIVDMNDARNHVKIDPRDVRDDTEECEADTSAGDTVEVGIDPMSALVADEESEEPAGEDSSDSSSTRDGIVRSFKDMPIDLDDIVRDFYHHMSEVRIDRIFGIETVQRRLEADQLIASGERARMTVRIESLRSENLKVHALFCIERDRVDSLRLHMSRSQEEFRQIRDDRDDLMRRLKSFTERRLGFRP
nr:hypothetical protein [Tanacetum cinerariifolium]